MEINELLEQYLSQTKDVTFPIHYADSSLLKRDFQPYGFSTDGSTFRTNWTMDFMDAARITAAFTGVIYTKEDNTSGTFEILLKVFSSRPLARINELPDWYPLPQYAKYGPFVPNEIEEIIRDLFTDNPSRITALIGGSDEEITQRLEQNANRVSTVESAYQ